ncbi:MAG: DUF4160 domain-containing protein [Bacteroidota bacterium]
MPEISRFFGIIIKMYIKDHNPPHFHAEYQDYVGEYDIQTLDLINGKLPPRVHALVIEWASYHKKELMEDWLLATNMESLKKIEPLQ